MKTLSRTSLGDVGGVKRYRDWDERRGEELHGLALLGCNATRCSLKFQRNAEPSLSLFGLLEVVEHGVWLSPSLSAQRRVIAFCKT